jgi:hypothetical protein
MCEISQDPDNEITHDCILDYCQNDNSFHFVYLELCQRQAFR